MHKVSRVDAMRFEPCKLEVQAEAASGVSCFITQTDTNTVAIHKGTSAYRLHTVNNSDQTT